MAPRKLKHFDDSIIPLIQNRSSKKKGALGLNLAMRWTNGNWLGTKSLGSSSSLASRALRLPLRKQLGSTYCYKLLYLASSSIECLSGRKTRSALCYYLQSDYNSVNQFHHKLIPKFSIVCLSLKHSNHCIIIPIVHR